MKDQKMCSFRLESTKFVNFKDFCARNNITMKDVLTKYVDLTLEAEQLEKESK